MKDAKKDRRWRAAVRLMRLIKKNFSEEEFITRQDLQVYLQERAQLRYLPQCRMLQLQLCRSKGRRQEKYIPASKKKSAQKNF